MPHPAVHRSLGAPSTASSPGAAWQDGGAKPAAAELWVSLPVSRGPGTGLGQPAGTQGPEPRFDPGGVRWQGAMCVRRSLDFPLPLCLPLPRSGMATSSPLKREVGESLPPEKVPLFRSSEAHTFPANTLRVHSVSGWHRLLPYGYKGKTKIPSFVQIGKHMNRHSMG